jgi:ubiquitin C-terminal hydrolase
MAKKSIHQAKTPAANDLENIIVDWKSGNISNVLKLLSHIGGIFVHGEHDAHEFFTALLDIAKIEDPFTGFYKCGLKCFACKQHSWHKEPFTSVILEVHPGTKMDIASAIIKHCDSEPLSDWKCEKCKATAGTKRIILDGFPHCLAIALKRYEAVDGKLKKVRTSVKFPRWMAIRKSGKKYSYHLKAVISHYGGLNGGHYISFVLRYTDGEEIAWFGIDDDVSQRVSESFVLDQKTSAVMLFYSSV